MPDARTIAIGDIHGCRGPLQTLLGEIKPTPDDLIIPLGDYVDRGPDSAGVIDDLIELSERCRLIPLRGNHEVMLLQAIDGEAMQARDFWLHCGGAETLDSYGGSVNDIPEPHLAFLHNLAIYHETESHILVHANYQPHQAMADQDEEWMLWRHMNEEWMPRPHESGKTVVVGHTPQISRRILDGGHVICIDTACAMGGCLTALEVHSRQYWQADGAGNVISDVLP